MALTDLTNTTWVLNDTLSSYPGGTYNRKTYNINIITEQPIANNWGNKTNDTFVACEIGYNNGSEYNRFDVWETSSESDDRTYPLAEGNDTKSLPDTWNTYYDKSFTITGGTDATNSTLIAWLEQNATAYTPPAPSVPDVVVSYKDTEVTTLSNSGTITLATSGTYCEDDIEIVYTKQGGGGILIVETPDSHGGTIMEVTGQNTVALQNALTITPTVPQQTIYPDTGFDGFASLIVNAAAVPEITVATSGAVTQELQPNVVYHFTSESLTSLTITFGGQATDQYHFDFISTTTPPTLTLPSTVIMPSSSFSVEVNTKYEIDILNNNGVFAEWVYEV